MKRLQVQLYGRWVAARTNQPNYGKDGQHRQQHDKEAGKTMKAEFVFQPSPVVMSCVKE